MDAEKDRETKVEGETRDANEGEGSRTAARRYNEATEKYVKSGKVDEAAHEAEEAVEGEEGEELKEAEEEGKRHIKERDHGMTGTRV